MNRISVAFVAVALGAASVFAADFIGEGGSYSGDLAVDGNWNPSGVPQNGTANFGYSGELTVGSPVTFSTANFTGSALEWALSDFGSGNLTIQDLTVTGTGSHLLLENGTLTIDGASPHVYIGGNGNAANILEVGQNATLQLKGGSIRVGNYRSPNTADAPGNTLRVSKGGSLSSSVNVLLGDGNGIGNSDSRVEVQGAELFELTGSANLNIGYRAGAFASRATFYDTAKVSIAATLGVGVNSAATNCVLIASNVTDFAVGGNMTVNNKASAELRDIANLTLKNVTVGSGSSFVMDGVTALAMSGTVTAGDEAGGSYVELHPPATFDAKKAVTVAGAAGAPNVLVFDGAGRTFESAAVTGFVKDGDLGNTTVELRNGTYRLTNVNRYRPTQPNQVYVIGPDATLDANVPSFTSGGNAFYMEGGSAAFGNPVEGIALVVDGGTLDFTTAPSTSGTLCLGSGGWGYGSIFTAKNNGVVKLPYDLSVGAESGIADACQVRFESGAAVSMRNFIVLTSNNRVTVSDATVSVASCRWPDNNSKWPNKPTELGDKANTPREATNNVFRFEGAAARLKATGDITSYRASGQVTELTLDFALPADGFDNVPVETDGNIVFQGDARLLVDASAYTGAAKWITLMKAGGNITVRDWDSFVAGIPEGVLVRFKDANRKELQVCVGDPYVFVGDAATPYSGDLGTAANWASGELPSDGDGRGDFTQGGTLSADAPVSFLEAWFLGSDAVWSVDTGDKWSLNKLIVGGNGADNQRVTLAAGTALSLTANGSTAPQVTVGSAGATNNVLEFAAGSSLTMPDGAILVDGTAGECNGNVFKADGATGVSAKSMTVRNGTSAEFRDVASLSVSGNIVVTGGGSLVISNATDLAIGGRVYVGSSTAENDGGATAELFMPSTFDPRNVYVGRYASDALRSLVYSAGGGSFSATDLTKFISDLREANVRVELRDGDYELKAATQQGYDYPDPQRYRPTNPNRAYVIGPGATMTLPKVRYGYAFYQEGQSEAYGKPIEGIAVIVDGGVLDLLDETGGYYMGSAGWGYGGIFEVKNGGRVQATQDFVIGGESGVADACRLLVASDGELNAAAFRILTSDNRVTISNGTVSVANCYWPGTGSKYPNNDNFGAKKNTPREATNNVVRFEGACPRLVVSGAIASYQDAGQKTSTTLEFVIPEGGYDRTMAPIEAGTGISFQSKLTVRIDPTAYTGVHRWMTLMKTTSGSISIADLDLSEVPDTCQVRLSADRKRLQVGLGEPVGMLLLVR